MTPDQAAKLDNIHFTLVGAGNPEHVRDVLEERRDEALAERVGQVAQDVAKLVARPGGTVTMSAQDKADIVAALTNSLGPAVQAAVRTVLGSLDGATPPAGT